MLQIRKNNKIIKLEKISRENFPETSQILGIPKGIFRNSREFFGNFSFTG